MVGFDFNETQEMFRREVRNFAQRDLAPGAKERAKLEAIPREIVRKLGDMGLLGISIPEKYGGQGADWTSVAIAIEEVAKVDCCASLFLVLPGVIYNALQHGAEELIDEWLPGIMKGEKMGGFAVTEPDAGADVAGIKMTATKDGDYYILNGEKTSITFGSYADVMMLFAKTDPIAKPKAISCFWVPLDLPGVTRNRIPHTGVKPWAAASIVMDGVRIPSKYLLGEEGKGFHLFGQAVNYQRVGVALIALGLAQASLEETINYAVQRFAFGQPIAKFEGVSFKIAEHATLIEAARLLCYQTLSLGEQGLLVIKEAAMCKWWCPVVAFNTIHECLLIHGHIGYSEEYPLEQRLRDVMGIEFTDSVAQVMKVIVARELMGRGAASF